MFGTISQEFWRGARVRQDATGTDLFTALVGLVGRNKRRYGGYIVHLGIVLLFLGFAGEGFKQSEQALLKPGQQVQVGDYVVRYDAMRVTDDGQKQMVTAQVTVLRDGEPFATMYPAKWFFRKHENQPTTEVAIQRGFAQDVYVVLAAFDTGGQTASLDVTIAPLVNWIWFGFGILALGTFVALLPDTVFAFATIKVPANAATTSLLLLALLLSPARGIRADDRGRSSPRRQLEQRRSKTRSSAPVAAASSSIENCPHDELPRGDAPDGEAARADRRGEDARRDRRRFREGLRQPGVLRRRIDRGFNRLAWLFPYLVSGRRVRGDFFHRPPLGASGHARARRRRGRRSRHERAPGR